MFLYKLINKFYNNFYNKAIKKTNNKLKLYIINN